MTYTFGCILWLLYISNGNLCQVQMLSGGTQPSLSVSADNHNSPVGVNRGGQITSPSSWLPTSLFTHALYPKGAHFASSPYYELFLACSGPEVEQPSGWFGPSVLPMVSTLGPSSCRLQYIPPFTPLTALCVLLGLSLYPWLTTAQYPGRGLCVPLLSTAAFSYINTN